MGQSPIQIVADSSSIQFSKNRRFFEARSSTLCRAALPVKPGGQTTCAPASSRPPDRLLSLKEPAPLSAGAEETFDPTCSDSRTYNVGPVLSIPGANRTRLASSALPAGGRRPRPVPRGETECTSWPCGCQSRGRTIATGRPPSERCLDWRTPAPCPPLAVRVSGRSRRWGLEWSAAEPDRRDLLATMHVPAIESLPRARARAIWPALGRVALVTAAALTSLAASWQDWIDPFVDSGRELNLPLRLAAGERLYR